MAPKKNYSQEQMQKAIDSVNNGEKISYAAQKYGVPRITLYNKMTGKSPLVCSMGPSTYLTKEEEHILETWILQMYDNHIPVTKDDLLDSVQRIITEKGIQTPFIDNRPGKKWYSLFLKRHPLISERTAQNLTSARDNVSEEDIRNWFSEIETYLTEKNLFTILQHPERVFNTDESAFYLAPKAGKVLAKKGEKHVYSSSGDDKENLTVLVTGNAAGQLAPTMVVFSYERIPSAVANNFPSDWAIGRSDTGWMCGGTFYEYIANIFSPWLDENNIERPVLFFLDGHKSHLTLHLSDFCVANGIEVIALNPNSTHLMQPMDLAVFRPLKSSWRKAVNNWKLQNLGQTLKKEHFASVLKTALDTLTSDSIKNGFRAGGLCPFGPDYIDMTKIKRSQRQETEDDVAKKDFFSYLETEISAVFTQKKLQEFRQFYFTSKDNLDVPEQDLSLYVIWAKNYDASSNTESEIHTQSAVNTQDFTAQNHTEAVVQNEVHPDVQDFSDMTSNPIISSPKMINHNEPKPGTSGTSKDPLDMTLDPLNSEQTIIIDPISGISQAACPNPVTSCSETMAPNETTTQSAVNTHDFTAHNHTEAVVQNEVHPDVRDFSDMTSNIIISSPKMINHIETKLGTSKDPSDMILDPLNSEQTIIIDPISGMSQAACPKPVTSCSETMASNETTTQSAVNTQDFTAQNHMEAVIQNEVLLDVQDFSDMTSNPTISSPKMINHNEPKPGTSKDPSDMTSDPLNSEQTIIIDPILSGKSQVACPKPVTSCSETMDPNETTNSSDVNVTAGPVTSGATPKKKVIKGGVVIPSPFKRNLFWPDENESKKKKRKLKEKIPFTIGSVAWRTYHRNKENEKQQKLVEKERRAEERKEKKRKREELKNKSIKKKSKKQVNLSISSDETDTEVKYAESDDSLYEEETNESLNDTRNISDDSSGTETDREPLSKISKKSNSTKTKKTQFKKSGVSEGCYVIIKYEGEYFPGMVEKVERQYYKVSTMTFSTGNTYRWPNKPDSIWYKEKDIVEKIQKPVLINKRGYYIVEEMKKFHTFTT